MIRHFSSVLSSSLLLILHKISVCIWVFTWGIFAFPFDSFWRDFMGEIFFPLTLCTPTNYTTGFHSNASFWSGDKSEFTTGPKRSRIKRGPWKAALGYRLTPAFAGGAQKGPGPFELGRAGPAGPGRSSSGSVSGGPTELWNEPGSSTCSAPFQPRGSPKPRLPFLKRWHISCLKDKSAITNPGI